jgi:NAD dependent epimerase/dehydratase family enzyme
MELLLGEMHQLLFTNTNISAQKVLDAGFTFDFPTAEKALQDILV